MASGTPQGAYLVAHASRPLRTDEPGQLAASTPNGGRHSFFEDYGVWQHAPVLTGTTKFEPLPDVRNIMVTGGAGFM